MGLYQPTVIKPSSFNGTGVIDATQDMQISFQINGTIPIYGWQFVISKNDTNSTVLYTSEWRHTYVDVYDPITQQTLHLITDTYGRDQDGNPVPVEDTITAADLAQANVVNNYTEGYKLKVNQKYSVYDNPNESPNVRYETMDNVSAVFFTAIETASFNVSVWQSSFGRYAWFATRLNDTAMHIQHYSFEPLIYSRMLFAYGDNPDDHIIDDSGNVYLANGENRVYGILKNNTSYAVRLTGQIESGMDLDTGWHYFSTSWNDTVPDYIHLNVYYVRNQPCTYISLDVDEGHDDSIVSSPPQYHRWTIYRVKVSDGSSEKVCVLPSGQNSVYDFGLKNNTEYYYQAYYGIGDEDGYRCDSRHIVMHYYWNWAIIEAEKETTTAYYLEQHSYTNTFYRVKRVHQFQGNVESGNISNENEPYVANNFTPYPMVQKHGRKGLSGTLKAWVGRVQNTQFKDSIDEVEAIMDMSVSNTVKFLRDRKGNLRMIEIDEPIQKTVQDQYSEQPVEIEIPWVEVGNADGLQIISSLEDGMVIPGDDIAYTTTEITSNGYVNWIYNDEDYLGSTIDMDENGYLVQTYDNGLNYVPATLTIDNAAGGGTSTQMTELTALTVVEDD